MTELTEDQRTNNADSRDRWDLFRAHRDRVTELLRGLAGGGPSRLCVLGAGNCNDLDLPSLADAYREVHLVDLDADALAAGVRRQGCGGRPSIHCLGNTDVTGVLDLLSAWSPKVAVRDEDLAACLDRPLRQVRPLLGGRFDVAASACLLSQIMNCVVKTAGEAHPRFTAALQALRAGHLRLLTDLVTPGGAAVLISDVVSSDTYPALPRVHESLLPALLHQLIRERNFFHGLNPAACASFFRTDPVAAPQIASLNYVGPWLWNFGPRVYLVLAWVLRKRPTLAARRGLQGQ